MCFSAPASFIASGALVVLSAATFAVARKKDKILLAIPLLFGIQQAFEGIQWLHLNHGSASPIAGYGFLFFAVIVWPVYVPFFVFMLDGKRKKVLRWFIFLGIAAALCFIELLATRTLRIYKYSECIDYSFNIPFVGVIRTLYLVAIFGPLFFSSRPIFRWFGLAIALLALVSWQLFLENFISVWCFFAAIVSSMFFVHVQQRRAPTRRNAVKAGLPP